MAIGFEIPYWPKQITKYSMYRLSGHNMSESARLAGYSPALQNQAGAQLEPKSQLRIKEALEAAGATNDVLAGVIVNGLNALRPDATTDYRERREYAKLALEAKGELKTNTAVQVNINLPDNWGSTWGAEEATPNQPTLYIDADDIETK